MRYLSVCSGIGSDAVAWHPLGWETAAFAEIDGHASAILQHHFPDIPNHGDFTNIEAAQYGPVDLLAGGTPCQSFSVAGLRGGLDDDRGNLALEFCRLAARCLPRWIVWENVPGVLSSNRGRDFGALVRALEELGYYVCWRVLDAQHVRVESHPRAVPQRRKRVFLVGYFGDWRPPVAVLLEPEGLRGDSPPRREAGQAPAPTLDARTTGGGGAWGTDFLCGGGAVAFGRNNTSGPIDTSHALSAHGGPHGRLDFETETFIAFDTTQITHPENRSNPQPGDPCPSLAPSAHAPAIAFSCKDHGADAGEVAPTLRAMPHDKSHANAGGQVAVAFDPRQDPLISGDVTGPLDTKMPGPALVRDFAVRRITPLEAERLMGLPDGWTAILYRGKPMADGPRYRLIGNGIAINCLRWIGERIAMFERVASDEEEAA